MTAKRSEVFREDMLFGSAGTRHFVYKVNCETHTGHGYSGEWGELFDARVTDLWGGTQSTTKDVCKDNFRAMGPGHRVWAYQTKSDRPRYSRKLVGLTKIARVRPVGRHDVELELEPLFRFVPLLDIGRAKARDPVLSQAFAFGQGSYGTCYELSRAEALALVKLALPRVERP